MKLLHTSTLEVRQFDEPLPEYAILSHTWGEEEVSYRDIRLGYEYFSRLRAFPKVRGCCRQAREDGYDWVWIDTCCIDKSSTAEVHEAINSMYSWYQNATVCYAYLVDVPRFGFRDSSWFERGWTLQELIAPRYVEFYSRDWTELGTKSSLEGVIASITGINADVLRGRSPLTCSVAERMSWAAGRRTSRIEDEAYCLLGIFDLNMAPIYGEGSKAFMRLQEELLRQSEDLSLLAWSASGIDNHGGSITGALAPNADVFNRPDLTSHLPSTAFDFDDAESLLLADMGSIDWRDVYPHQWGSSLEMLPLHQFLFDPPSITARGISTTMLVDLSELEYCENKDQNAQSDTVDVLAWIYTDVVLRPSPGSRRTSRSDSRQGSDNTDRSLMVCIWVSVSRTELQLQAPARAVRVWNKNPVCVPMIFVNRFQPRRLYLQYGPERHAPSEVSWSLPAQYIGKAPFGGHKLDIKLKQREDAQVEIISHFPHQALLSLAKHTTTTCSSVLSSSSSSTTKHASLWIPSTPSFDVIITGCQAMEASSILLCAIPNLASCSSSSSSSPSLPTHFVIIIGPPPSSSNSSRLNIHLEALDPSLTKFFDQNIFWPKYFSTQNRHNDMEDFGEAPSDRASMLLECGVCVSVGIKRRMIKQSSEFVPTLVISTEGYGVGAGSSDRRSKLSLDEKMRALEYDGREGEEELRDDNSVV